MSELTRHRLTVRFSDCDLLGHVNNSRYLSYLEEARIEMWLHQLGPFDPSIARKGSRGHAFILARTEIDFCAQARYPDLLEVRISLGAFGRTSLTYEYEIVRVADDVCVGRAKTVQVWFDYDTNTPVVIDDALKVRLTAQV